MTDEVFLQVLEANPAAPPTFIEATDPLEAGPAPGPGGDKQYFVVVGDIYNNGPSAGATVTIDAQDCAIVNGEI